LQPFLLIYSETDLSLYILMILSSVLNQSDWSVNFLTPTALLRKIRLRILPLFCLFHLYLPVTRKRQWRYILDKSSSASELFISGCFFDLIPLNLLLVRSHQAEIIIVKCLIQRRNNMCAEGGS